MYGLCEISYVSTAPLGSSRGLLPVLFSAVKLSASCSDTGPFIDLYIDQGNSVKWHGVITRIINRILHDDCCGKVFIFLIENI